MSFENYERLAKLEQIVQGHGEEIEDMGGTLDHVVNTMDTILMPGYQRHEEAIAEHRTVIAEVRDYISGQKGIWTFLTRVFLVLGTVASVGTFVWKVALGK